MPKWHVPSRKMMRKTVDRPLQFLFAAPTQLLGLTAGCRRQRMISAKSFTERRSKEVGGRWSKISRHRKFKRHRSICYSRDEIVPSIYQQQVLLNDFAKRDCVRWFSVTMGTGIVSILLHNLPYNGIWLYWISVVIFALNVLLFTSFLIISILRYVLYPQIWFAMIRHPAQSLFLGTFPMGLATIINMIVFVCVPAWNTWAVYLVRVSRLC